MAYSRRPTYVGYVGAFVLAWLAGCAASEGTDADRVTEAQASDAVENLALDDAPDARDFDVKRYDLRGELDWTRHRLVATVALSLRRVDPALSAITLDSAVATVKGVRLAEGRPLRYTVDAAHRTLRVELPPPAKAEPSRDRQRLFQIEIDYEADAAVASEGATDTSFYMMPALAGDPVPVRTAFTISEPTNAPRWMPCHDVPHDRAVFSIEMRLPEDEKMIANGHLISDHPSERDHRVKYDSGVSLPTYLMSFATGDFEVETRQKGQLPVSIWHRRGLRVDDDRMFSETFRVLDLYESLFGAYPFETYASVFTPFGWGMENATMSLLGERVIDYDFAAGNTFAMHELSHQWFGDAVTIEGWDDLWFKEGMATLLEMESQRIYLDESVSRTLGGDRKAPRPGEAIRDPSLDPHHKGSGPYARAAWLLTQIRSVVGEESFWRALRKVLREYRFGAIGTDAFIDAFAPYLGPGVTAQVRKAVDAKALPRLDVVPSPSSRAGAFLTLSDPEGALITPVRVRWMAEDGSSREQVLEPNARVELAPSKTGEFLVLDPDDVHPDLSVFAAEAGAASANNYKLAILPLRVPKGERAIAQWLEVGGIHQLAVLAKSWPEVAPEAFPAFMKGLDSEGAKALALQRACDVASGLRPDDPRRDAWAKVLEQALSEPPHTMGLASIAADKRYDSCSKVVSIEDIFAADWARFESDPASQAVTSGRVSYLARFALPPARAFTVWSNLARHAASLNAREQATARLVRDAAFVAPDDKARWRAVFEGLLLESEDDSVLVNAVDGVLATKGATADENADSVHALSVVLHDPLDYWAGFGHSYALCGAFRLLDDSSAWQTFVDGLSDANLQPDIQSLADDPTGCDDILPVTAPAPRLH